MIKTRITLLGLGIYPNLKGFDYVERAVELVKRASSKLIITKKIYPLIATEYGDTPSKVERAIRHLICKIDSKTLAKLGILKTPTNSEFIYFLAELD